MPQALINELSGSFGQISAILDANPGIMVAIILLSVWSLIWKGLALWRCAENKSKTWFVILLVVNTLGLLEIVYYFWIGRKKVDSVV